MAMATISQFPFSLPFLSFHFRKPLFYSHQQQSQLFVSYLNSTKKKHNFVCFACSIKQTRVRKRVKSNEELRNEIIEFVALNRFPQGHVPSMKELSAHGRVDLANVVRRRGYKFIKELLANSDVEEGCNELVSEENTKMEASESGFPLKDLLTEGQGEEALDLNDGDLSTKRLASTEMSLTAVDGSMYIDQKMDSFAEGGAFENVNPVAEEFGSVSDDESSLVGVSSMENSLSYLGVSKQSGEITEDSLKDESGELSNRADIEDSSSEALISAKRSLALDDTSSFADREADNILMTEDHAEEYASVSNDESSLAGVSSMGNSLTNFGDSNHSEEVAENTLKVETMEFNNKADIENSSSEALASTNDALVLVDTSSCSDKEADNVLMAEDVKISDVDEDLSLTYDHYTSQDLNSKYVDIDDMAENHSGSADDSLVGFSYSTSSIEERTARFIQNGYLDTVDDDDDILNDIYPEETKESAETSTGEYIGDSYGGRRSVSTPPNGSDLALEEVIRAAEVSSSDRNSDQRDGRDDLDKDPHDEIRKRENQVEITRLRFMLRQKELELSKLKEQIEKEKLSLSVLQKQAETEIQKAQMLVSEKEVELQEAEESLSGLKEVEIEYCGDGNVVEVTGSFNGWEHRVGLELQASKSIGKQKCWSALLWLYPGTYEIKFIVDGQWTTDPHRDSITKGHITNNILKVSR